MARVSSFINYQSGHGYSISEIIVLGNKYIELATQNIEDLGKVGINEEFIHNLNTKTQELVEMPSEQIDRNAKKKATNNKNVIKNIFKSV